MLEGRKVRVVDASGFYPWKQDLIGRIGVVGKATEKAARVDGLLDEGVWFALDCLEEVEEEEAS